MIFVAIVWGAPFIWMFVTSIKPDTEVFSYPPTWWPDQPTLEFYTRLFESFPMLQWFRNSLIVATITTVLTLATNILAAYPLAQDALPRPQDCPAYHLCRPSCCRARFCWCRSSWA